MPHFHQVAGIVLERFPVVAIATDDEVELAFHAVDRGPHGTRPHQERPGLVVLVFKEVHPSTDTARKPTAAAAAASSSVAVVRHCELLLERCFHLHAIKRNLL
jgi:hypothetical protein